MHVFVTVSIFTVLLTVAKSHRMSSYQAEFSAGKTLPSYVKKIILSLHNNARRNVNPPAKNMLEMIWDDGLAKTAEHWANKCVRGHDNLQDRVTYSLPGVNVGQNFAGMTYYNWYDAVKMWTSEGKFFYYGHAGMNDNFKQVGHYTQIVNWQTSRVGCAVAKCHYWYHYLCNYAPIRLTNEHTKPYLSGPTCGACPHSCQNKLCSNKCSGRVCNLYQSPDVKSPDCACQYRFKRFRLYPL